MLSSNVLPIRFTCDCGAALVPFWLGANRSFASEAAKQDLPQGEECWQPRRPAKNPDYEVPWFFGQRGSVVFLHSLVDWDQKNSWYCCVDSRPRWLGLAHLYELYLVYSGLPLLCCETRRPSVWTVVVATRNACFFLPFVNIVVVSVTCGYRLVCVRQQLCQPKGFV